MSALAFPPLLSSAEQDEWLAQRRAEMARANAALPAILAEMRAAGLLRPMRHPGPRKPLFERHPLDADYWDNEQTIEAGE